MAYPPAGRPPLLAGRAAPSTDVPVCAALPRGPWSTSLGRAALPPRGAPSREVDMAQARDVKALSYPYRELHDELSHIIPAERLICDPLRTLAFGTDASFYRLVPKLVVRVRSSGE